MRVTTTVAEPFSPEKAVVPLAAGGNLSRAQDFFPVHALVVDDEPLIRWSVAESLVGLGFVVEQAPDAATALKMVTTATLPYDVVVLDLRLPDMQDLSLLGTVRQLLPRAVLVLMTAFGTHTIEADARALGATVLTKPFELADLNRIVLEHTSGQD
jgi:DNA-binding response OmpR family regulator